MAFIWAMPESWLTTFVAAGVGFLPVLFAGLTMASPSRRSSPMKEALQYEEGARRWEDEQARRGHGGMLWLLDWEYEWGDRLIDTN
ncbi:hypothetical protein N431DRAFT_425648 [Stipitochalara longipes BDJ]|nr:hypothetical protein N431DRAFT_425648 [Stipitochalara longipes BDJ]